MEIRRKGYYKLYRDNVYVSRHNQDYKAYEKAIELHKQYPNSQFFIKHPERIDIEFENKNKSPDTPTLKSVT